MADSSSYWSDWVHNIPAPSQQAAPQKSYPKNPLDPNDPNYDPKLDPHNNQYDPNDPRLIGGVNTYLAKGYSPPTPDTSQPPPIAGPQPPASQQPTIPIQTAQGAPQGPTQQLQTAPNSGMIGASPYANQALTGGSGMPTGGLPTQSPAASLNSPQQVQPQQMQQPPLAGPANPQFRMQTHQQNMQKFAQLMKSLGGYNFLNQYSGQG